MKFFDRKLVNLNNNGDYESKIKYKANWKEYKEKHIPFIRSQKFASHFLELYNYHFHDCQLLKIEFKDYHKNLFIGLNGRLKPLMMECKEDYSNYLDIRGLKFINAQIIISDIPVPFSRFKKGYQKFKFIYFNHDEVDVNLDNKKCIWRFLLQGSINRVDENSERDYKSYDFDLDIEFDSIEIIY